MGQWMRDVAEDERVGKLCLNSCIYCLALYKVTIP